MDIRQLKCFIAVLTTGAMTRAADLLCLAQPTVSTTIAQLEKEIGFTLFKRSKGWLEPTPEAFVFHPTALAAIESFTRVSQAASEIKQLNVGEIKIICYPGIAWHLMPNLIAKFRSEHANIKVKLISHSSSTLHQLIMTQGFDIAVVEAPAPKLSANHELFDYKCLCAMSPGNPLTEKSSITAIDLSDVPVAMLFADHSTHHQIRAAFSSAGANLIIALECNYFETAANFTQASDGVAIIDPITASHLEPGLLILKPFEPAINYQLLLARPENRAKSGLSDKFYQYLHDKLLALQ
jgi:DNA-binding transcriptional LysR family regulator